jgi:hypothetical protein
MDTLASSATATAIGTFLILFLSGSQNAGRHGIRAPISINTALDQAAFAT